MPGARRNIFDGTSLKPAGDTASRLGRQAAGHEVQRRSSLDRWTANEENGSVIRAQRAGKIAKQMPKQLATRTPAITAVFQSRARRQMEKCPLVWQFLPGFGAGPTVCESGNCLTKNSFRHIMPTRL